MWEAKELSGTHFPWRSYSSSRGETSGIKLLTFMKKKDTGYWLDPPLLSGKRSASDLLLVDRLRSRLRQRMGLDRPGVEGCPIDYTGAAAAALVDVLRSAVGAGVETPGGRACLGRHLCQSKKCEMMWSVSWKLYRPYHPSVVNVSKRQNLLSSMCRSDRRYTVYIVSSSERIWPWSDHDVCGSAV